MRPPCRPQGTTQPSCDAHHRWGRAAARCPASAAGTSGVHASECLHRSGGRRVAARVGQQRQPRGPACSSRHATPARSQECHCSIGHSCGGALTGTLARADQVWRVVLREDIWGRKGAGAEVKRSCIAAQSRNPNTGRPMGRLCPRTFSQQTRQEPVSAASPVPTSTLAAPMAGRRSGPLRAVEAHPAQVAVKEGKWGGQLKHWAAVRGAAGARRASQRGPAATAPAGRAPTGPWRSSSVAGRR